MPRPGGTIIGLALRWTLRLIAAWLVLTAGPVILLRWMPPLTSSFMLQARLQALSAGHFRYHAQYRWTPLTRISPQVQLAVIASEDQRFPFHDGFDLRSIREALEDHAEGEPLRGASTISQQTAKNLFLWGGRSYLRKALEAWFTLLMEHLWPKTRILEMYLNLAQFGDGVYGVGAAAPRYFHRSPAELSQGQAALLAAVLPNPVRLRADHPSAYVLSRRDFIMGQMRELGGVAYLHNLMKRP
ncbi:MAG TPA: monofunctional biosynthetic peptidoglycan transglycosylase [Steroidobacteraceae bacterium]|nr:monofunctional biosynthetic peptidoglycan transglycosylase [Steroidobacteraceae bacterium]